MRLLTAFVLFGALAAVTGAQAPAGRSTLDIYVIDVEGGNATLFVAPGGESLLIDTGNGGAAAARDAGRILEAAQDAGLTQIDHVISTHYHGDHIGGLVELARRMPIRHYIDHGPNVQASPNSAAFDAMYAELYGAARRTIARPGDEIALGRAQARIVMSAGEPIQAPLEGAGQPNPYCETFRPTNPDQGENAQSVGTHVTFGRFRTVMLGDLTWNKEAELMCPRNRLGTVDLFLVSHHGLPSSNSPVLVHALAPRAAVMNNGTRKGGQPATMRVLHTSPGLEDLWQLHFSVLSGQEYTVPGLFIANLVDEQPSAMPISPAPADAPAPAHDSVAYWIRIAASEDGSFLVTNTRNRFTRAYRARP